MTFAKPSTWIETRCDANGTLRACCGHCGCPHMAHLHRPIEFPVRIHPPIECSNCGAPIYVAIRGFFLNPATEEQPAIEVPKLSGRLPRLERAWAKPAAHRNGEGPKPCPLDAERHPLRYWVAMGQVSPSLPPATLSKAYRWVYGRSPYRQRQSCVYSEAELLQALQALGVPAAS